MPTILFRRILSAWRERLSILESREMGGVLILWCYDLIRFNASIQISQNPDSSTGKGSNASYRLRMIHYAMTDVRGFYRFRDVAAGETYIFSATVKRFELAPQVVYVTEELQHLNFTSQ